MTARSPGPASPRPGTIAASILAAATEFGTEPAIVAGDRSLSFVELAEAAMDVARSLAAVGVDRGDRVAIWAPNSINWAVVALGAYVSGTCLVPMNSRYTGTEAADILERSGATLVFISPTFLDRDFRAELLAASLPSCVAGIVSLDEDDPPTDADRSGRADGSATTPGVAPGETIPWSTFVRCGVDVDRSAALARASDIDPDDLADILFTSGTTGSAKGVMLTHRATVVAYETWCDVVGLRRGDRYLVINPFSHAFGLKAGLVAAILRGATIHPHAVFDAVETMRTIERARITVLPGAPTIYQVLLDHPAREDFDLTSLELAVTGAADVPVELISRMKRELGFDRICTGYGLTEATGLVSMCRPGEDLETVATTAGRPIPGIEVRIVGADGATLAADEIGEVTVRGFNVAPGYHGDPQATAEAIDGDGWLRTGDLGALTPGGFLRITGRLKDMFIVGGFNVYPAEVESAISRHPGVSQVAVVGRPDTRLGEVGAAFVVARPGVELDLEELEAWCRERLANYKMPRTFARVDSLPTNSTGKVVKAQLPRS